MQVAVLQALGLLQEQLLELRHRLLQSGLGLQGRHLGRQPFGEAVGGVLRAAAEVWWSSSRRRSSAMGRGGGGVVVRVVCVVLSFLL